MPGQHDRSLQQRVEQLETAVETIQHMLEPKAPSPRPNPRPAPAPVKRRPKNSGIMWKSESWLKIVGIGLLLLGVGFLFKFSIDQGWITETVRVGFALLLGSALFATGLHIHEHRRAFSQVLLGGSVATFYIAGFAAFQLYALVSHSTAFGYMASVTALAFFLALRQHQTILSIIGALGGLGTPLLLHTGSENLPGLIAYTCLVLSGTSVIYMYRGWRSLLWTSVVGGWAVLLIGHIESDISSDYHRWALQAGILFAWIAFWALPVTREVLWERDPIRWPRPSLDGLDRSLRNLALPSHVHTLSVSTPLIALVMSRLLWSLPLETWGWILMGGAMVYGVAAQSLRRTCNSGTLPYTQALVSLLLLTIGLCHLLRGDTLFLTLAAEAVVLHLICRRLSDHGTAISAHLLFAAVGIWLAERLSVTPVSGMAVLNVKALMYLAVIAAASGISVVFQSSTAQLGYRLAAHAALLGWLLKELSAVDGGQGYVTIAWGLYAIILLLIGLRQNLNQLVMVAMGTLLLVVGKLFVVDLAEVESIWRILLFLGFGGIFLVLSYYFQNLWKRPSESAGKTT